MKESVSVSGQATLALLPQSAEVGASLERCHAQTSNNAPEGGGEGIKLKMKNQYAFVILKTLNDFSSMAHSLI